MIFPFFRKSSFSEPVYAVYNAIVAQSRREILYTEWGVEDSLTGRFDSICLHAALVFRRLRGSESQTRAFAQSLFDCFFRDMDRSLREMGVGDLSVGKRIEKMGGLFYGLLRALTEALDARDHAEVEAILTRNFHGGERHPLVESFADYVFLCDDVLLTQPVEDILAGRVFFGDPK